MLDHLTVADCLHRRWILFQARVEETTGFFHQSEMEHQLDAPINSLVKIAGVTAQSEESGWWLSCIGGPRCPLDRERLSCQPDDFDCTNDSTRILPINAGKCNRV